MTQNNLEIIRGIYTAFAAGDGATVLANMTPDVVWNEAENFIYADRNPYVGPGAIAEGVFTRCMTEWVDFKVTAQEYLDAGHTVVTLGRYTGTHATSGMSLDAQFGHIWRLQDGKVVSFQQYTDTLQANRVSGS